jgi:hypothetical protein
MSLFKVTFTFLAILVISVTASAKYVGPTCGPERQYISMPSGRGGTYTRVHPSGNYMLVSGMGDVKILDLTKNPAGVIDTPMIDETFPVQPSWDLLASPNHDDGMRYYMFKDIKERKASARPVFNDEKHNEYYHSSAQLPGTNSSTKKIRTLLYSNGSYKDYEFKMSGGSVSSVASGGEKKICSGGLSGPGAPLPISSAEREQKISEINRMIGDLEQRQNNASSASERQSLRAQRNQLIMQLQMYYQRSEFDRPILSQDGTEFGGHLGGTAKIVTIVGDKCIIEKDLGLETSKINFSHKKPGKKGQVAFVSNEKAYLYDRDKDLLVDITGPGEGIDGYYSYPGFTGDGRLIYQTKQNGEYKVVIVDPNQIDSRLGGCIRNQGAVNENIQ